MVEMSKYASGTPCWVDVTTPDIARTVSFYSELFGWVGNDQGEDFGHYTTFTLNGLDVAACMPMPPGGYPGWNSYVSVNDIDAAVALAEDNGAKTIAAPMEVPTAGKMAVLSDPTGAVFSLWQPGAHIGAQLVNEPNTFCWNELMTRDMDTAKDFYEEVFGWDSHTTESPTMAYTEFKLGDKTLAGGMSITPEMGQMPANWLVYFAVADCDATVAKAQQLGATVVRPGTDIPVGRFAVLTDPCGATFAIIKFAGTN